MRIYNSLSRLVEEVVPLKPSRVGMYTCGMTVYDYAHIGHGRKYVYDDLLRRTLMYNGFEVTHVQNVTDVGHLESDADEGRDKMEKGAEKLKRTVWEVADHFTRDFYETMDLLNIQRPTVVARATEHIAEQIELVGKLLAKRFAYDTTEAVYFDVAKFPRYNGLFGMKMEEREVAVRVGVQTGEHKKNPADFALWFKAVGRFSNHAMVWDSPWGRGFPGWHIECSAMSMKYLGESFDIHTGGMEHQMVHHPNEIAQSEAASGKPLAKYWVHYGHLLVDGVKMAKSLGNVLRVQDVAGKGYSPLALRYLYLTAHYRAPLNFTWSSLTAAQTAYDKLKQFVQETHSAGSGQARNKNQETKRTELSREKLKKLDQYKARFDEAVNNDLSLPEAVAVIWETMKSNIPDYDKADALLDWDQVLGLGFGSLEAGDEVPSEVLDLGQKREGLRRGGEYVRADEVRLEIERRGWEIQDTPGGVKYKKRRSNA